MSPVAASQFQRVPWAVAGQREHVTRSLCVRRRHRVRCRAVTSVAAGVRSVMGLSTVGPDRTRGHDARTLRRQRWWALSRGVSSRSATAIGLSARHVPVRDPNVQRPAMALQALLKLHDRRVVPRILLHVRRARGRGRRRRGTRRGAVRAREECSPADAAAEGCDRLPACAEGCLPRLEPLQGPLDCCGLRTTHSDVAHAVTSQRQPDDHGSLCGKAAKRENWVSGHRR